MYVQIVSTIH